MSYAISAIRRNIEGTLVEVQLHRIIDFSDPPLTLEIDTFSIEEAIALAKQGRLRIHTHSPARYYVEVGIAPNGQETLVDRQATPIELHLQNLPTFCSYLSAEKTACVNDS